MLAVFGEGIEQVFRTQDTDVEVVVFSFDVSGEFGDDVLDFLFFGQPLIERAAVTCLGAFVIDAVTFVELFVKRLFDGYCQVGVFFLVLGFAEQTCGF